MIVAMTADSPMEKETHWVNRMLEHGVDVLHVRKPHDKPKQVARFIRSIHPDYLSRVALHYHHGIAEKLGITRLHFSEKERLAGKHRSFNGQYVLSTSIHNVVDFNRLGKEWSYAFLSPVFASISKPGYGVEHTVLDQFDQRCNPQVKMIALGGVHPGNIDVVLSAGADGVALNGALWNHNNPLEILKRCKQKDPLYSA